MRVNTDALRELQSLISEAQDYLAGLELQAETLEQAYEEHRAAQESREEAEESEDPSYEESLADDQEQEAESLAVEAWDDLANFDRDMLRGYAFDMEETLRQLDPKLP